MSWKQHELDIAHSFGAITARQHTNGTGNRQLAGDIHLPPDWSWLHIEAKRHKRLAIPAWVEQVETDLAECGEPDKDWLLVVKRWGKGDVSKAYAVTEFGQARRWLDAYREVRP